MRSMNIQPGGTAGLQLSYAVGKFAESDGAFVVTQLGGDSPFGSIACSFGSDYAVHLSPDGSGRSLYGGLDVTPISGQGKAWYVKDRESGAVWSPFFSPVCVKADEHEVRFMPGQVRAFSIKEKIASTLTVSTVPGSTCEIWHVKLENRSASSRSLSFTTYAEPCLGHNMEATYLGQQKALLVRRPLSAVQPGSGDAAGDMVVFHSSTLAPARYEIQKSAFVGEGRTLRNPRGLEENDEAAESDVVSNAIASFTVEVELPIEGEAEFAFCFGVTDSPENALEMAQRFTKIEAVTQAMDISSAYWRDLCSSLRVTTPDTALNAMLNVWLPYEAYTGWIKQRTGGVCLEPNRVADTLRRLYSLIPTAPQACHEDALMFAAGLSILNTYSPDNVSLVALPPRELLWLAACAERYVAETGDLGILEEGIALKDGPYLTLKEHCERIMRMCTHAEDALDDPLLEQVIRHWSLINGGADEFGPYLEKMAARRSDERSQPPEQRHLPRRVRYFQSASPTLRDPEVTREIERFFSMDTAPDGESGAACCVYVAVADRVLGIEPTSEGLSLHPRLPESWTKCDLVRRYRGDTYIIRMKRMPRAKQGLSIVVDGEPVLGDMLPFFSDGREHRVDVVIS